MAMQPPECLQSKSVIWKERSESVTTADDEQMRRVVDIIKSGDESGLYAWTESCDDVNMRDSWGNTALHWAAGLGDVRAVTHLLLVGVQTDVTNSNNATPLHCAALGGHLAIIEQLLRYGADATAKNCDSKTMFDLLRDMGWKSASLLYKRLENALCSSPGRNCGAINAQCLEGSVLGLGSPAGVHDGLQLQLTYTNTSYGSDEGERDLYYGVSCNEVTVFAENELAALRWNAELAMICSEETAGRCEIIREYAECMLNVAQMIRPEKSYFSCVGTRDVEMVFGEKHSSTGTRLLLVRMAGDSEGREVWVNAKHVAHCQKVTEYMERVDHTDTELSFSRNPTEGNRSFAAGLTDPTAGQGVSRMLAHMPPSGTLPNLKITESSLSLSLATQLAPLRNPPVLRKAPLNATPSRSQPFCLSTGEASRGAPANNAVLAGHTATNVTDRSMCDDRIGNSAATLPYIKENWPASGIVESGRNLPLNESKRVESKLPPLRQRLSSKERAEYEKVLRQSALRYLMRKREMAGF